MRTMCVRKILVFGAALLALALIFGVPRAKADSLHGACSSPACPDNGTVSPTNVATPTYGFAVSPGGQTGDLLIVALIPDNDTVGSFSVTGGTTSPATEVLVSTTAWTSGSLTAYLNTNDSSLGIGGTPNNPIGAFLPTTQSLNSGATGYFVYVANLGTNALPGANSPTTPFFDVVTGMPTTAFDFPLGSSIVGFLNEGNATAPDWVATANSGQISIGTTPPVPEPTSLGLLGLGLCALVGLGRRTKLSMS